MTDPAARGSGVTLRSLPTGVVLSVCISTGAPYGNMVDFSTAARG